jgi:hypothetical protein
MEIKYALNYRISAHIFHPVSLWYISILFRLRLVLSKWPEGEYFTDAFVSILSVPCCAMNT